MYKNVQEDYGQLPDSTEQTIRNTINKFEEAGNAEDRVRPVHHRRARSTENGVAAVRVSVAKERSIRRRSQIVFTIALFDEFFMHFCTCRRSSPLNKAMDCLVVGLELRIPVMS